MKTQDKRLRFVELRAAGWSFSKIATELSVSKSTLVEWSRDLAEDIANLRVVETDALIEASRIGHENRIRLLGTLLEKLNQEVLQREFEDLPTDKLIELSLKLVGITERTAVLPQFTHTTTRSLADVCLDEATIAKKDSWSA